MSINVSAVVVASDTFGSWIDKFNNAAAIVSSNAVTADATANGSTTSGNAYFSGHFAATTLCAGTLSGGNNQSAASLQVLTNTYFGNSTVNVAVNSTALSVAGGSFLVNSTVWLLGNSTVNVVANSSQILLNDTTSNVLITSAAVIVANSTFTTEIVRDSVSTDGAGLFGTELAVGSNILFSTSTLTIGNSTVNVAVNSSQVTVGNAQVTPSTLQVGNSTVNTVANSSYVSTGVANLNSNVLVGANVFLSTGTLSIGNSTVNVIANSTVVQASGNATHNSTTFAVGNSTVNAVVNSSSITVSNGKFTTQVNVGSNLVLTTASTTVGNSTVNVFINSTSIVVGNSTVNATLNATSTTIPRAIVYVGGSLVGTQSAINFIQGGAATISASQDDSDGYINVTISASATLPGGAGGANTDVLFNDSGTIGGGSSLTWDKTTNILTLANSVSVGANTTVGNNSVSIGNSTVNAVLGRTSLVIGNSTVTSTVNSTTVVVNAGSFSANVTVGANIVLTTSTITVGNSTVNSVVNSTTVSTANGVYSAQVSVGANVALTTGLLSLGNSTVNLVANSTSLVVGSATINSGTINVGTANVTTQLNVGSNLSINTSVVQVSNFSLSYVSFTTTGTSAQTIDTLTIASWRTAKYLTQITDNGANNYQASELILLNDGSNGHVVEYGIVVTNTALGSWSATNNSTIISLQFTPISSNTTVKLVKTALAP